MGNFYWNFFLPVVFVTGMVKLIRCSGNCTANDNAGNDSSNSSNNSSSSGNSSNYGNSVFVTYEMLSKLFYILDCEA